MTPITIEELKREPCWVWWYPEEERTRDGGTRINKVPRSAVKRDRNGGYSKAKVDDPSTWGTYGAAQAAVEQFNRANPDHATAGLGIVFHGTVCGIDIDGEKNHTQANPLAAEVLQHFEGTYAERSPSRTGFHVLGLVDVNNLPDPHFTEHFKKNSKKGLEIYIYGLTNRFFTFTGDKLDSHVDALCDITDAVLEFLDKYMMRQEKAVKTAPGGQISRIPTEQRNRPQKQTDPDGIPVDTEGDRQINVDERLEAALADNHDPRFTELFNGSLDGNNGDPSVADLALCAKLCFYMDGDPAAIDTAFRRSKLLRPKWDVVHDGIHTYGEMTITKALDLWTADGAQSYGQVLARKEEFKRRTWKREGYRDKHGNHCKYSFDLDVTENELWALNVDVQLNIVTREIEISGSTPAGYLYTLETLVTQLRSSVGDYYKGATVQTISDNIVFVASERRYNPILDYLTGLTWDGQDRFPAVYEALGVCNEDVLSQVLIRKWFMQTVCMVRNDEREPFGADGVLVLKGEQGTGKTSFLRSLSPKPHWFLEGAHLDSSDKDTIRRAVTHWIVELGEIESTFKSDIEWLKATITSSFDEYRLPYGRTDVKHARRASFCASCNSDRFLIDQTGNRRYWTVETVINLEKVRQLDVNMLWAQIEADVAEKIAQGGNYGSVFRLTDEEQQMLAERNGDHVKPMKGEDEVLDILKDAENRPHAYHTESMTTSEWIEEYPTLRRLSVQQVGAVLVKLGIECDRRRRRNLPVRNVEVEGENVSRLFPRSMK